MERIEEYNALRQEIIQKDEQYNEYRRQACTFTVAILAFSVIQTVEPLICLLPIFIIIPFFILSELCMKNELKLGAYIYVFFSDDRFLWEKRNNERVSRNNGRYARLVELLNDASIYITLVSVCVILSIYKTFSGSYSGITYLGRILFAVIIWIISLMIIITKKISIRYERDKYIGDFNTIKNEELKKNNRNMSTEIK